MKIGFIGQGFIGKAYADDYEERGYNVVRYSKSQSETKEEIAECEIVFIAVPTPSTPDGFSYQIVEDVLPLVGKGKIAIVKSTILPGTIEKLQEKFPDIYVFHSPEFLTAVNAGHDARHPFQNIVGVPDKSRAWEKAWFVLETMAKAPNNRVVNVRSAEYRKYYANVWFVYKIMHGNIAYDLCQATDTPFDSVKELATGDPRIGYSHLDVVHDGGRGAGGYCFIKDFAAWVRFYEDKVDLSVERHRLGLEMLKAMERYNVHLLNESKKDPELLKGVYGEV